MTKKNERGAGRKPTGMVEVMVRLTPKQAEWLRCKGQSATARNLIEIAMVGKRVERQDIPRVIIRAIQLTEQLAETLGIKLDDCKNIRSIQKNMEVSNER